MQILSREWNWLSNPSSNELSPSLVVFSFSLSSAYWCCLLPIRYVLIAIDIDLSIWLVVPFKCRCLAWLNRNESVTLCHVSFWRGKKKNANAHTHKSPTHCRLRKQSIDSHLTKLVNHNRSIGSTFSVMCLRSRVCVCSQKQKLCI